MLIVAFCALFLSFSSIFSRFAYDQGTNPQTILVLRFMAASLMCLFLLILSKGVIRLPENRRLPVYFAGIFYTLGSGSLLASLYFLPVSLAIVLIYTYPMITLLAKRLLDRQFPTRFEIGCFLIAFIGLILALDIREIILDPIGLAFAATASLSIATSYLISDRKLSDLPSIQLTLHLALSGIVLASLFVILSGTFKFGNYNTENVVAIIGAIATFVLAFYLMFKGLSMAGAVKTTMLLNLEPIITVGLSVLILNEVLTSIQLIGIVLVITAILLLQDFVKQKLGQGS